MIDTRGEELAVGIERAAAFLASFVALGGQAEARRTPAAAAPACPVSPRRSRPVFAFR